MKIEGYAPDVPSDTPGVLVNCANFIPSMKGYQGAPSAVSLGIDALAAACQGAAILTELNDTTRLIAGTGTKLYELSGTSWTDRTRASGGNYAPAGDIRWSFAQFGDISLAVQKADVLQASVTGAFANLTAPKASDVETVGQFVFLFDTNEATYGDSPNRWWCCAKGDYTNWVPSITLECATGLLTSSPGPTKGGKRFGDAIVAYKEKSMFLGVYLGAPNVWDFRELPGGAGALSKSVIVDVGTSEDPKHIFMGHDNFYKFDGGARAIPIGNPVRETVYGELNRAFAHLSCALHDPVKGRVFFYYCSSGNLTPDKCVVYNYKTGKWGRDDRTIEYPLQYLAAGVTYDDLGSLYSTYNDLPSVSYDSSFFTSRAPIPAIFNSSHVLQSLNGPSTTSSMTTGDMGDDQVVSLLSRVNPRFLTKPTSANMVNFYRDALGDTLNQDQTTAMSSSRFDVLRSARWHRLRFDWTGPVELAMFFPQITQDGDE